MTGIPGHDAGMCGHDETEYALEEHLALALKTLEDDPNTVASTVSWPWIMGALLTSLMN